MTPSDWVANWGRHSGSLSSTFSFFILMLEASLPESCWGTPESLSIYPALAPTHFMPPRTVLQLFSVSSPTWIMDYSIQAVAGFHFPCVFTL